MNKKEQFCNYPEKAKWVRRWKNTKNKKFVVKAFCQSFPKRYDYKTWYGRTIARNSLVNWEKKYNLDTLKNKKRKGNWVPKRKIKISDLDKSDQEVYQEIVEDILESHNISKDEIAKRIKEKKEKIKNKKNMCSIFKINRRNIYRIPVGPKKPQKIIEEEINLVKEIYENSFKIYGYRKCSKVANLPEWKVRRIYKILNINSMRQTKQRKPKEIKITNEKYSNLVNRDFNPLTPNQFWHIDVTYIKINNNWMYFSAVIDSYNKKILDWKISKNHDTSLAISNLEDAIKKYGVPKIIHSDHGYEYKSFKYIQFCKNNNIEISMSKIGDSLDNRPIEFFFSLLKRECLRINKFKTLVKLNDLISKYIKWYNEKRIQENLYWKAPVTFVGYVRQ